MTTPNKPVSRSGRFSEGPSADVISFGESVSYDWRLWKQDIVGSIAHAKVLQTAGFLSEQECEDITSGLETIGEEISTQRFEWRKDLEDVHMNIEAELTRRVPAGAKLHTARSRNDQIALDMRMWLRDEMILVTEGIRQLQRSLVNLADRHRKVIIPGYTHLQRAQPVLAAHHLLAYVEMLERDHSRQLDCFERVNVCPLGSGAIAGSTLVLDRNLAAELLGFVDAEGLPRVSQNSMDAVSDRDFIVEFCSACALMAVHLSRMSEDFILWSSEEFGFIRISDAYTTGSSLMPQKKNPDMAELTRGKSARVIGNLVSLLVLLKGLPMTYNRDLQEDKEQLFDTVDTIHACLGIMSGMIDHTKFREDRCASASSDPSLLATDLADYLVRKKVPFREAHHLVGAVVSHAEATKKPLNTLTLKDFQSLDTRFKKDVLEVFELDRGLKLRKTIGGPGPQQVASQLKRWKNILKQTG